VERSQHCWTEATSCGVICVCWAPAGRRSGELLFMIVRFITRSVVYRLATHLENLEKWGKGKEKSGKCVLACGQLPWVLFLTQNMEERSCGTSIFWVEVSVERALLVSCRLSIVTTVLCLTIRPQFAIKCLRCSNQHWWVTLGQNLGRKRWVGDRCKPNFNVIWERLGAVAWERNCVDIFCCLSTVHERDRQTDHGM